MAQQRERGVPSFEEIQQEQLSIYAAELAQLYALVRKRSKVWLEAEERLRERGAHTEVLHQVLSAAYTCSQLLLDEELPADTRRAYAEGLPRMLERGLTVLREYRSATGDQARDDLGLAALLRAELYSLASEFGWDIQVETEAVRPTAMSEVAAYLIVREALRHAATQRRTRRVTLGLTAQGDRQLNPLTLSFEPEGGARGAPDRNAEALLTRLSARLAGGSCRWRTLPPQPHARLSAAEVELDLPLEAAPLPQGRVGAAAPLAGTPDAGAG